MAKRRQSQTVHFTLLGTHYISLVFSYFSQFSR